MSDPPTPTVWRHWLAAALRRSRENAGKTLDEVAEVLECSRAKVSRIERGRVSVHPREVEIMLDLYGVPARERSQLVQLARDARRKGWWHQYRDLDPDSGPKQVAFVDNETAATLIRIYQMNVIAGLFQTEDYARAVLRAIRLDLSDEEVSRHVELRMKRQALLYQADCPRVWTVLDEAVLRRPIGGRETFRDALKHLAELAEHPKVELQVLPYEVGAHAGLDGSFIVLGYAESGRSEITDKDTIYLENTISDQYLDEVESVKTYVALFEAISREAYGIERSKEFIAKVRKEV